MVPWRNIEDFRCRCVRCGARRGVPERGVLISTWIFVALLATSFTLTQTDCYVLKSTHSCKFITAFRVLHATEQSLWPFGVPVTKTRDHPDMLTPGHPFILSDRRYHSGPTLAVPNVLNSSLLSFKTWQVSSQRSQSTWWWRNCETLHVRIATSHETNAGAKSSNLYSSRCPKDMNPAARNRSSRQTACWQCVTWYTLDIYI